MGKALCHRSSFPKQADEGANLDSVRTTWLRAVPSTSPSCLLMALRAAILELGSDGGCQPAR